MIGTKTKQPVEVLDYDIDFSKWLPSGDVIESVVATIDVVGELAVDSTALMSPIAKVWLSGGVDGSTYKITVTVTTQEGRVKQEEFKLRVREQ